MWLFSVLAVLVLFLSASEFEWRSLFCDDLVYYGLWHGRDMRLQFGTLLADIGLIDLPKHFPVSVQYQIINILKFYMSLFLLNQYNVLFLST